MSAVNRSRSLPLLVGAVLVLGLVLVARAGAQGGASAGGERFALLVGVDDYAQQSDPALQITPLKGPRNDVRLMGKLLVDRYGFKADKEHLVTLVGNQATRAAILETFRTHLIAKAASHPNAALVFYFSGHGSQAFNVSVGDQSVHDTLVAFDSRVGKGRDILDNELVALFEEARQHTSEITIVLDSCHSGSAIKSADTLTSRELPPAYYGAVAALPATATTAKAPDEDHSLRSRRLQFALLSASQAGESSYENLVRTADGPRYHGYFTFFLDQALRAHPDATVARATEDAARALGKFAPYQHPQAVGNIDGRLFGGGGDRDDPYLRLLAAPKDGKFQFEAGAVQGVREGALIAIYPPDARKLTGAQRLASATVAKVGDVVSDGVLSDAAASVPADAKVVLVTPFYGHEPLHLRVDDEKGDDATRAELTRLLSGNALVTVVQGTSPYDFTVRRGCLSGETYVTATQIARSMPSPCALTYYISPGDIDASLLGPPIVKGEENSITKVVGRVEQLAKQRNVRALDNVTSPLKDKVRIELRTGTAKLGTDPKNPEFLPDGKPNIVTSGTLRVGELFRIRLNNTSDRDLFIAVLMLGTSGKIELITVNPRGDSVPAHTTTESFAVRRIGPPLGLETYKAFATTSPTVDYRLLEQDGAKGITTSPLEELVARTTDSVPKDSIPVGPVDLDEWTTTLVDVLVKP